MKKLLIVGALLVAGPAWAQSAWSEAPEMHVVGPAPDISTVRPMHMQNNMSFDMGTTVIEEHPIHLPQSLFITQTAPYTTDLFHSAPHGKDCVITLGGGHDINFGDGCDLSSQPGAIKARDPAGALIIRKAQP